MSTFHSKVENIVARVIRSSFPGHSFSDKTVISLLYRMRFGRTIDFKNPRTFNEKLLWLTIYDRKPEYTQMVDKYKAKELIYRKVGEQYYPKNLGIWKSTKEIVLESLPKRYVLKCNHDSGSVVICNNRLPSRDELKSLDVAVKKNYFWFSREWPYKNVEPVIFAEEFIESPSIKKGGLVDYKFYCFNGVPYMTCVISNRSIRPYLTFMNLKWEKINVQQRYANHPIPPERPKKYEEMMRVARILSENIPFLRVDFFEQNNRLFVGEMTFTPSSGLIGFTPDIFDYELGDLLVLPKDI